MIAVRFFQGAVVVASVAALCAAVANSPSGSTASYVGENGGDKVGKTLVSAGDVNNDGYDDFLIGSPDNDDGGGKAGKVYLILGKAAGWVDDVALSGADASFIGENANDKAGTSIAGIGDVNNDGFDDIAIGAIQNSAGGSKAGTTYVFFGKAAGWATGIDLSTADASFIGENADDKSGQTVAGAGNVNNDSYSDFIIGSVNNADGGAKAGKVYLILGKAAGWTTGINLSTADASFIGEVANDKAGSALAGLGDVNNDGFDDIAIGANQYGAGGSKVGAAYVVFGKAAGWTTGIDLSTADASFVGEVDDDEAGSALAGIGDVNNDGFDDIAISAPRNSAGGSKAGTTYVVLGKAAGWATGTDLSLADASFVGENASDKAGTAVSGAGDVDNDGFTDFLIGSTANSDAGNAAGKAYLILGKAAGWSMGIDLALADASYLGESGGDKFGDGLFAAGDLNQDGYGDFVIASTFDSTAGASAGKVYLYFGSDQITITSWREVEPN